MKECGHVRLGGCPSVGELIGALGDVPREYDVSAVVRTSGGRVLGGVVLCDLDWMDGHDPLGMVRDATLTLVVRDGDVVEGGVLEDVPRWVLERVLETGRTPDYCELMGLDLDEGLEG